MNPNTPQEIGAPRAGSGHKGKRIDLVKLAVAQKQLLWCVLARIGLEVGGFTLMGGGGQALGTAGMIGVGSYLLVSLAIAVVSIVFIARMAIAYGIHPAMGILGGLAIILPCAGLIMLLLLNQRVTTTLKAAGCKVGLMGVSATEMHKLRLGVCPGCGYDLRGLTQSACPECGSAITHANSA